jgi:hypothetical protein
MRGMTDTILFGVFRLTVSCLKPRKLKFTGVKFNLLFYMGMKLVLSR